MKVFQMLIFDCWMISQSFLLVGRVAQMNCQVVYWSQKSSLLFGLDSHKQYWLQMAVGCSLCPASWLVTDGSRALELEACGWPLLL